jgi:DNA-binding LytR/AlgR family response regulator
MGLPPINCVIVDDDNLDSAVIRENISAFPAFRLAGLYSNPIESLEILRTGKIDLLFLDVQMPAINGVDFLKALPDPPLCIFITQYPEYAIGAFEAQAIDYLLKPVRPERFRQAAIRAMDYFDIRKKALEYSLRFEYDFLLVKEGMNTTKVLVDDIRYIEALANYTRIVTADRKLITLSNLKHFMEQLPAEKFVRVHRSYAVALDKVKTLLPNELVVEGVRIPIGKLYRQAAIQQFQTKSFNDKKTR